MSSTKKKKKSYARTFLDFLGSNTIFYLVLTLFFVQASWFVLSAGFPMLYDEFTHVKTIELYSSQGGAFGLTQTAQDTQLLGDVTRTGSYLYYSLMSYAYSFILSVSGSFYVQIVFLRFLNVLMVLAGLVLYRKTLLAAKFSKKSINVAFLFVTSLPIFPYVSAHVNYDNLLFLFCAFFVHLGTRIIIQKKTSLPEIIGFISVGLLGSVVKYSFLPVFFIGVLYVSLTLLKRRLKDKKVSFKNYKKKKLFIYVASIILLVFSIGLFTERYVQNIYSYGQLDPKCSVVQAEEDCNKQKIIKRNNDARERQLEDPQDTKNIVFFMKDIFIPHMVEDLGSVAVGIMHSSIDEQIIPEPGQRYDAKPLSFLVSVLWLALVLAFVFVAKSWRKVVDMGSANYFYIAIISFYAFVLGYLVLYKSYQELGVAYAVQPRYFIMFMPIIATFVVQAASFSIKRSRHKILLMVIGVILLSQGGGMLTYLVSSDDNWFWNGRNITNINESLREAASGFILSAEDVDRNFNK